MVESVNQKVEFTYLRWENGDFKNLEAKIRQVIAKIQLEKATKNNRKLNTYKD